MSTKNFRPATTYPAVVGYVLAWHRARIQLTQGQIAERLGTSPSTWSRIERGECALTMDQLAAVASVLRTQPGQILQDADQVSQQLAARGIKVVKQRVPKPVDAGLALLAGAVLGALVSSALSQEEQEEKP